MTVTVRPTFRIWLAALAVALLACGCGKKAEPTGGDGPTPTGDDNARAQGQWVIEKVEAADGKSMPDQLRTAVVVTIDGDRLIIARPREVDDKFYGKLTVRPDTSPKEFDLIETDEKGEPQQLVMPTGKGKVMFAIYKFEGDTLVVAAPAKPGEPRPTGFAPVGRVAVAYLKKK